MSQHKIPTWMERMEADSKTRRWHFHFDHYRDAEVAALRSRVEELEKAIGDILDSRDDEDEYKAIFRAAELVGAKGGHHG